MKLIYTVETKTVQEMIEQSLFLEGPMTKKAEEIQSWCMDTREKATRDALVKLGWTPPKTNPPAAGEEEL
jgi:hypothetical protein